MFEENFSLAFAQAPSSINWTSFSYYQPYQTKCHKASLDNIESSILCSRHLCTGPVERRLSLQRKMRRRRNGFFTDGWLQAVCWVFLHSQCWWCLKSVICTYFKDLLLGRCTIALDSFDSLSLSRTWLLASSTQKGPWKSRKAKWSRRKRFWSKTPLLGILGWVYGTTTDAWLYLSF